MKNDDLLQNGDFCFIGFRKTDLSICTDTKQVRSNHQSVILSGGNKAEFEVLPSIMQRQFRVVVTTMQNVFHHETNLDGRVRGATMANTQMRMASS